MKNLQTLRKSNKLTLIQLAKDLGISHQVLSNYELGKASPSTDFIVKLADYFNCSIDYLLGHQTKSTLQLEGFTEAQRKIIELVSKLTPEQSWFALGKLSDILGLPYDAVKPGRPF